MDWGTRMNTIAKGAIAAGAAVVLLTGGLGSYALWSDQAQVAGGTIRSGYLALSVQEATWSDVTTGTPLPFDPATDQIVPGDVIRYTANAVVDGAGKNLEATLLADTADIGGDLLPYLDVTMTVDSITTSDLSYDLGAIDGAEAYPIQLDFSFDAGTSFNEGMYAAVNLDDFELTLVQNPNP